MNKYIIILSLLIILFSVIQSKSVTNKLNNRHISKLITKKINKYREQVYKGDIYGQPKAKNKFKPVKWNSRLSNDADKILKTTTSIFKKENKLKYPNINKFYKVTKRPPRTKDIIKVVNNWKEENNNYVYGHRNDLENWYNYYNLVYENSYDIGCSYRIIQKDQYHFYFICLFETPQECYYNYDPYVCV